MPDLTLSALQVEIWSWGSQEEFALARVYVGTQDFFETLAFPHWLQLVTLYWEGGVLDAVRPQFTHELGGIEVF